MAGAAADRMSPVALFLDADIVVKAVMIGPAACQHLDLVDHRRAMVEDAPHRSGE
jgi:hypothetical protein